MLDVVNIDWPAPANVKAFTTTRRGGISTDIYQGLNLGSHVNDHNAHVEENRKRLQECLSLPSQPKWLNQIHGVNIVNADKVSELVDADGSYTTTPRCVCAVLTADCLPVFISDLKGSIVGVFHAGWRGLADGILNNAVKTIGVHSPDLVAALGPAISQSAFEVGVEVKQCFASKYTGTDDFFQPSKKHNHYYADLYGLAEAQLYQLGVKSVWRPKSVCTYKESDQFYSYRRDGQTGRMASLIWMH